MSAGRELVYGRQPVREALRGRREVLELWVTDRALAAEPWLQETARPRPQVKADGAIEESAGTRDHQGVLAFCEPYRYADALALAKSPGPERPLIVVLDQVTDPHNLGAVCRSAEGAGATCVVIPKDGAVHVTPAVCKTSAGAVEHIPDALLAQLGEGGRLAAVIGTGPVGRATLLTKLRGVASPRILFDAGVSPLKGFTKEAGFVF